jgi:hypothetical protein
LNNLNPIRSYGQSIVCGFEGQAYTSMPFGPFFLLARLISDAAPMSIMIPASAAKTIGAVFIVSGSCEEIEPEQ